MSSKDQILTPSQEDYLKTIFEIISEKKVARVRDIAIIRNVKPGSVSPALRRLSDSGLIIYNQGEYITLTEEGKCIAIKTLTRHKLLYKFLAQVLQVNPEDAEKDACAMEHNLSNASVNKLTSFFEFLEMCPEGQNFLKQYLKCPMTSGTMADSEFTCNEHSLINSYRKLSELESGETGTLFHIHSEKSEREHLINMGFLPGCKISVEKKHKGSSKITVKIDENTVEINFEDAEAILLI